MYQFEPELPENNETNGLGEYIASTHSVVISKNSVLAEIYEEPIHRLVMHELGHACDQSIYYGEDQKNTIKLDGMLPLENEIIHLTSKFGTDAEAIFSDHYTDTLDWISLGRPYGAF